MSSDQVIRKLEANVDRFSGMARCYDANRPHPPEVLLAVVTELIQCERPRLVVDLGSGTGLSTRFWSDRAEEVIGLEPNDDMLSWARSLSAADFRNVSYRKGFAHETGLPDGCADIVTCAQSLHWMEPATTMKEICRILRRGGVFAFVNHCDLPTMPWEAVVALGDFLAKIENLVSIAEKQDPQKDNVVSWNKDQHLAHMQASNSFRFIKSCLLHSVEIGNAERLIGFALSLGNTTRLLKSGLTESEIGIDELRVAAKRILDDAGTPWYFSFETILAVK